MYDRMVNHHGLRNLIWVWTREPNDDAWYPGDQYVDIIGRDIYKDGDHSSQTLEFSDLNSRYGGRKMVTLSEAGSFPDADNLVKDEAAWSWYMPWYGDYTRQSKYNSLDLWKKMFAHDYVITLDEMPSLSTYIRQDPVKVPTGIWDKILEKPGFVAYPTLATDKVTIRSEKRIEFIAVYDAGGRLIKQQQVDHSKTALVSLADFTPGVYFLCVNQTGMVRVVKK
jgi:mannan endo-1,4-beta-mannosidase